MSVGRHRRENAAGHPNADPPLQSARIHTTPHIDIISRPSGHVATDFDPRYRVSILSPPRLDSLVSLRRQLLRGLSRHPASDDSDDGDGSTTGSSSDDLGPRPDWWPEDWPWPPEPEEPVVLEAYPPIHTWPRLPPDHPYHVPPGYSAPDNLPPGHPGEYYPDMPPYPVVHRVQANDDDDAASETWSGS